MNQDTTKIVIDTIKEVIEQNELQTVELKPDMDILTDSPLDSLDLAEVIMRLEEKTNMDPFASGFINFRTINELAELYKSK